MQGLHLTADLYQCRCDAAWLTDADRLGAWCVQAVQRAGLQPVNQLAHAFPAAPRGPGGVTATVLLAESHLSLHTYPEQGKAFFDAFTCGVQYEPANIFHAFAARTLPGRYRITCLDRGSSAHPHGLRSA